MTLVTICGSIGVGKTTLLGELVHGIRANGLPEPITENPYLVDARRAPDRWSFHSQLFFLIHRYAQLREIRQSEVYIQDRGPDEVQLIFAAAAYRKGHLTDAEWALLASLHEALRDGSPRSSLLVYVRCEPQIALERIRRRARLFELDIGLDELVELHGRYETFVRQTQIPVVTFDTQQHVVDGPSYRLEVARVCERIVGLAGGMDP